MPLINTAALEQWKNQPHGPRVQAKAIAFILGRLETHDLFDSEIGINSVTITEIFRDCNRQYTPDVSVATLRRWWYLYEEWGKLPYKASERKKDFKKKKKRDPIPTEI